MVDRLVTYVAQIRTLQQKFNFSVGSIIAMDEIALWSGMSAESTVDKTDKENIPLKTTR